MLFRKLIRTAGRYRAQFISMIIMTALGIGIFVGFNMEWYTIERDISSFFERTGFSDQRIISAAGFSSEDVRKVKSIGGVERGEIYQRQHVGKRRRHGRADGDGGHRRFGVHRHLGRGV